MPRRPNISSKQMRTVERALTETPYYILGDRFTAADILLSTCVTWAIGYGVAVSEAVQAYNNRVTARPAYARALQTNASPATPRMQDQRAGPVVPGRDEHIAPDPHRGDH